MSKKLTSERVGQRFVHAEGAVIDRYTEYTEYTLLELSPDNRLVKLHCCGDEKGRWHKREYIEEGRITWLSPAIDPTRKTKKK